MIIIQCFRIWNLNCIYHVRDQYQKKVIMEAWSKVFSSNCHFGQRDEEKEKEAAIFPLGIAVRQIHLAWPTNWAMCCVPPWASPISVGDAPLFEVPWIHLQQILEYAHCFAVMWVCKRINYIQFSLHMHFPKCKDLLL